MRAMSTRKRLKALDAAASCKEPTMVTLTDAPDVKVAHPAGQFFKPKFSVEAISMKARP